jgi:hypothetical protein
MARARVRGKLQRERLQREIAAAGGAPELPVPKPKPPPPLTRGGTPKHPRWYRVLAVVQKHFGIAPEFVAEAKTFAEAIELASRYPHRAYVTDWHSKVLFNNGKPIEKESHRVE